jgi:hypothetical protein
MAEDQTALGSGIAVIRGGISVEPDVIHMREIAADLAHEFMPCACCSNAGPFHDLTAPKIRPYLTDHIEIGVKTPRSDHKRLATNLYGLSALRVDSLQAAYPAVLSEDLDCCCGGQDICDPPVVHGVDQNCGDAQAIIIGSVPARDSIALLKPHIDPLHPKALGPKVEIVERMLDIEPCPLFVRRALSPLDPILKGIVGGVMNSLRFLQRASHNKTTAAGDD